MEQEERWNVYIPDEDVTVNVPKTWGYDRIMSEYSKERENVLKVNREQLNKERFEKLAGFDYSKDYFNKIQLNLAEKKIGEETNPLLTFGKSAINQISDLTIGSLSKGAGVVGDVTAGVVGAYKARELSPKQREKFLKDVDEAGKEIVEKGKDIAENMQFNIRQGESEVAQGLGSILTSYGLMGLTGAYGVFGKGMKVSEALRKGLPVASLFGVGSGLSMYEKVREQGGQIPEALGKGTAAGAGETLLEEVGVYGLLKGTRMKLFKKFPWAGYIVSAGGTGAVQETSQTLKDIAIAGERDVREADEKLNELIDSAIYGTIGEIFGGVVSSASHKDMRNKIRTQAVEAGYDEQTANVIAWEATENPQGVTQAFLDTMKNVKVFSDEEIRKGQEYIEEAIEKGGVEADRFIELKETLKNKMLDAGFEEKRADRESDYQATLDVSLWNLLNDMGAKIKFGDFMDKRVQSIQNIDKYATITREKGFSLFSSAQGLEEESLPDNLKGDDTLFAKDTLWVKGSYRDGVVKLFKGNTPDTLMHELSHNFFENYFTLTEEYGLQDRNKAIYDMLGKKSSKEFRRTEWESITEEFMKYIRTNEAPNIAARNLFERAKDWIIKTFYSVNKSEEVSPEIKEFFDNLISQDTRNMDLTDLQMTPRAFKDVLKSIKSGNEVGLKGVRRKDLQALRKVMHTLTPRNARSIAEEMRRDNMQIKSDSELAKQLGYDSKKKQLAFSEKGNIDSMDMLDQYLVDKGLLEPNLTETYEQTSDRENQIENIIYQAEDVYSPEEQSIADRRKAIEYNKGKASELIDEILKDNELGIKDIDELTQYLDKAIDMARSADAILVNKNAIDFLVSGYENAEKLSSKLEKELEKAKSNLSETKEKLKTTATELEKATKDARKYQDIVGVREQLAEYIRRLPLNAQHRLSLLDKVKQVQKGDDFTDVLSKINDSFRTMWEQETKTLLKNNIDLIVKSTKPKDRKHQKYNYEYNKLFEEFRKINSMNKADASNALVDFMQNKLLDESEFTEADKVKNLLLSYKANGMKSSVALMRQLENALYELRNAAIEDRLSTLEAKAERKQKQISEMIDHVNSSKKVDVLNATALKATNLYSNEAELFGKKWAEAHEMETVELEQNMKVKKIIDKQIKEGKEIYGVTGDYDYAKLLNEKSQRKFTLYGINGKAEGSVKDISLMDIMDIYLTIKNKRSREIYDWLYEQHDEEGNTLTHNIQDLLDNLSDADKKFADSLQKKVQSWREAENKVYVDLYGIDMPQHEEYWMRSSEKPEKELMDIKQFANVDMIPSFFKERSAFPFASPENVWVKFQKRANDSVYMTNTFKKFKEQYDLIHNHKVANAVTAKYDSQRFASLTNSLNDVSLKGNSEIFDEAQNLISQGIGNWVVSQIAVNPAVFTKQLVSLTNYAENMNVGDFVKYEAEFLMNPVKAIQFMREFDKEFLDYRFSSGMQNEVLGKIMGDAERNLSKYGYTYQKYLDLITLPVRYGDVGAIYIGGYARVKQLLRDGYSLDEARKIFRFETQRSQQSGLKSSLAQFQKNRYAKILTAFKNTQLQYMRKMQDSYIQWRRGEISTKQASKIWGNYMFIQAIAYQVLTNVFGYLRDDDDDKEMDWFKDVIMQVTTSPIAGVPLLGEMAQDMIRDKHYDLGMAGLGDVNKFLRQAHSVRKKYEEDEMDAKSVFKGIATLLQFVTPLPNNIINPILND